MKKHISPVVSWLIVVWIAWVFLNSIPYKFSPLINGTVNPDTDYIFGSIGDWMSDVFGEGLGTLFHAQGPFLVGSFEILTSLVLLAPIVIWLLQLARVGNWPGARRAFHRWGGLMASAVMAGAMFFHVFTPLGIQVLHQGESDGGSLFYAAVSIFVLGIVLYLLNRRRPV